MEEWCAPRSPTYADMVGVWEGERLVLLGWTFLSKGKMNNTFGRPAKINLSLNYMHFEYFYKLQNFLLFYYAFLNYLSLPQI